MLKIHLIQLFDLSHTRSGPIDVHPDSSAALRSPFCSYPTMGNPGNSLETTLAISDHRFSFALAGKNTLDMPTALAPKLAMNPAIHPPSHVQKF